MKYFLHPSKSLNPETVGGKAYNLNRLHNMGMPVPKWVVIPQDLPSQLAGKAHSDTQTLEKAIDAYAFDNGFMEELETAFPNYSNKQFAVRSSGVQEDGSEFSFAGQFESYLYVKADEIPSAIKKIWKSAFSERVQAYRENNEIDQNFGIGVIIQEMVDPDASGVAFGANPNSGALDQKVICAVYGVGEGLVSGELDADTFTITGEKIERQIAQKTHALVKADAGGTDKIAIQENQQTVAAISDEKIGEIEKVLDKLQTELGQAQDIEFAIKDDQLYLLQTRPITTLNQVPDGKHKIIWDNSNIIESYPGVTTPLTFSYILVGYRNVYMQLARIMGASEKIIKREYDTFSNMLGMIKGRVYYNLLAWYKVLAIFPGYALNARFMENMMGVKERFDLPQDQQMNKFLAFYRVMVMVFRIFQNLFTIKKQTRAFLEEVDQIIRDYKSMDLSEKSAYELMELFKSYDAKLLARWKAPLINDSFAMISFGRLQEMIKSKKIGNNPNLQNDLMCGNSDIISVEPIRRSLDIATIIAESSELKTLFESYDHKEIWQILQSDQSGKFTKVKAAIDAYIHDFGDRCVGELKLETISYSQDPSLFIQMIKNLVVQGVTSASTNSDLEQKIRKDAEAEVRKALIGKPYLRWKFNRILAKARYFVSNRENLRYDRTRVFGVTRSIFLQIGSVFEREYILAEARDIFYLSMPEIFQFIEGTSIDTDLRAIVAHRKEVYAEYAEMPAPPERIVTYGPVHIGNDFRAASTGEVLEGDLQGIGCCPGKVKARVQLVQHPSELDGLNGDILVTSSTDPGWVTLFPTASAILVERGSLLSHSAIVSREMGIPCIVSVPNLLKRLKTGDLVEMDGASGIIKIIES